MFWLLRIFLDEKLGPIVRSFCYSYILADRSLALALFDQNTTKIEQFLVKLNWERIYPRIMKAVNADFSQEARDKMENEIFDLLDGLKPRLQKHKFLCGDSFSAADLTLASLLAPLVLPKEMEKVYFSIDFQHERIQQSVKRIREHPLGKLALEIYSKHRFSLKGDPNDGQEKRNRMVDLKFSPERNKIGFGFFVLGSVLVGLIATVFYWIR